MRNLETMATAIFAMMQSKSRILSKAHFRENCKFTTVDLETQRNEEHSFNINKISWMETS